MPTSRFTGSQVDLIDLEASLIAFEEMNECTVTVTLSSALSGGVKRVFVEAVAYTSRSADVGDVGLVSVRQTLTGGTLRSMDAVLFNLLYTIDGKLAAYEMQAPQNIGTMPPAVE